LTIEVSLWEGSSKLFADHRTSILLFINMTNSKNNSSTSNHSDKTTGGKSSEPARAEPKPPREKLIFPLEANGKLEFSEQPDSTTQRLSE
jgi:hypothetical protein